MRGNRRWRAFGKRIRWGIGFGSFMSAWIPPKSLWPEFAIACKLGVMTFRLKTSSGVSPRAFPLWVRFCRTPMRRWFLTIPTASPILPFGSMGHFVGGLPRKRRPIRGSRVRFNAKIGGNESPIGARTCQTLRACNRCEHGRAFSIVSALAAFRSGALTIRACVRLVG